MGRNGTESGGLGRSGTRFNGLTPAQVERLALLIEECGEVIQAATKILRHGYESYNPTVENGPSNRHALERELGDVRWATQLMVNAGDLDHGEILLHQQSKGLRVEPYLHHQEADHAG